MSNFEVGQRVIIAADVVNVYGDVGKWGTLLNKSEFTPGYWNVRVFFDGTQSDEFTLSENEFLLAPLDTQPPTAGAPRGDGIDAGVLAAGIAEMRRYVEGNGFKWCEDEDAVFNVTTALGWMGGAIESLRAEKEAAREALRACINADVTGYWSPEEVAKRFFAAYPDAAE